MEIKKKIVKSRKVLADKCNIETVKSAYNDLWKSAVQYIFDNIKMFSVLIEIFFPTIVYFMKDVSILLLVCLGVVFTFITRYLDIIYDKIRNRSEYNMPLPPRIFTSKDIYGFISLKDENDYMDMIVYVNQLEEFLLKCGEIEEKSIDKQ